ncbi:MAG: GAF domain-containing protein, partial [Alphaproteobacteria bacterium]
IENVRLFEELQARTEDLTESLQQQTATADVLKVISRSTFDLQPVLDAVTETSVRLCAADSGHLAIRQGEGYRAVATCGVRAAHEPGLRGRVFLPGRDTVIGRSLLERRIVHVADLAADPEYGAPSAINVGGSRTVIAVPLVREGEPIGVMALSRRRVEPFAERQIELIRTFADQAVIAIENTRLITETREALEQQTATAEVLQVINSSPGDLAPVFDAMLEKALRLCNAIQGVLWRIDGERVTIAAHHNMAADFIQLLHQVERGEVDLPPPLRRIMQGERIVYVPDVVQHELYRIGDPLAKMAVESGRVRTLIWVALVKDNIPVGAFAIARREVRSFSEKEIALLQNFAAQAVIAMENARLLTETREALEQQTAIGEVLRVISGSAFDLQPVLQSVVSTAIRLCRADQAVIYRNSDGEYRWAAGKSLAPEYEQIEREIRIRPGIGTLVGRAALWAETVQIIDCQSDPDYEAKDDARVGGIHTLLGVPLLRDGVPIGVIGLARRRVEAYNDREIELVRTFADQAVIAIENARLLTETREALEQQTATAEVLQVINSSPGDLAPVFDAVLQKAHQLCEASFGALMTFDGEKFYPVATQGVPARFRQFIRDGGIRPSSGNPFARMVEGEAFSHIHDLSEVAAAFPDDPLPRAAADLGGIRSLLIVPLRKDEALLGVITAYRQEVRPFTAKQIALLQNFAAQAVIAMENARLLGELRQRTRDLEESLEYQTATSDVLKVISRSTFDLEPVLNSVSAAAARLCGGDMSGIAIRKGDVYQYIGAFSIDPEWERIARRLEFVPGRDTLAGRVILTGQPVHIPNLATDPEYTLSAAVSIGKIRTALGVPLLREGQPIGVIFVGRYRIELFTERQIELVRTFADQAAIAIENTRLLTELRDALAQQTATAEILEVINRSPGDLTPVFDAMLEKATRLCEAKYGQLATYSAEGFQGVAAVGLPMESADALSRLGHPPPETVLGRVERTRQTVQMADIAQEPSYAKVFRINPWLRRVHTSLVVPLLKEGELVGTIHAFREEVRPFSDKQIGLLENFAAQAVIAMDNARLLNEIRQRQAELRVTFDNMGDGVAMFDGDMRLAAWNRNFQQILELPDEFVAQHPTFPEYFRYMAARGEYRSTEFEAEIGRYVEDPGHEARFERTRPDGRVIEVRRNAVPGGGFVLIVGDVTERKRAEAEIRAARDAAETALRNLQAAQASLVQAQKMAALGQLTAGIAHEIKNPLNFVNNFAGLSIELLDELKETAAPGIAALDDDARSDIDETIAMLTGNLDKIAEHGRRADNIVKSMLEHSRGVSGERRAVDLNALVDEALNLAYHGARAQDQSFNITLERDLQPGLAPIAVAPQEMMRVFLNLFSNGFYAAARRARDGGDGSFRPTLAVATRDEGEAVAVTVRDNGAGIPPEIRDRLFQPFFTTKPSGEGTGLGLSISYDIVAQQHGGTIAIDSEPGAYTEFTIRLPRRAATGVAA